MLTIEELQHLMSDLESDKIERTTSTTNTDKFCQAICAFSNDFPNHRCSGYLLIGVNDDGSPSGLHASDRLLQNLAALRSAGNIQPLPALTVQKYTLPNAVGDVAVVEVFPSDLPPVRYKGRVWIRVGPRRAIASEVEERLLSERRTKVVTHFDARPCLGSTLDDLNLGMFQIDYLPNAISEDVLEENQRTLKEQLASLRCYDLEKDCPTYAGILLFGEKPTWWIPGAYVQFVRFAGPTVSDEIENDQALSGNLISVLRDSETLIQLNNQKYPVTVTLLREQMWFAYPELTLKELMRNAVMHRWYDNSTTPIRFYWFTDHVEIKSPGGLYGEVTPENFPNQTAYRNPVLAEAMKVLGYVNKFGIGVQRAQQALLKNGNSPAAFFFDPTYVQVTVRQA